MREMIEKLQREVSENCQALGVRDIYGYGIILGSLLGLLTSPRILQIALGSKCTFLALIAKYLLSVLFFLLACVLILLIDVLSEKVKENPNLLRQIGFLFTYLLLFTFVYLCSAFLGFDGILLLGLGYLFTKVKIKNFVNRE